MTSSERVYRAYVSPHVARLRRRERRTGFVLLAIGGAICAWLAHVAISRHFELRPDRLWPFLIPAVLSAVAAFYLYPVGRSFEQQLASHEIVWTYISLGPGPFVTMVLSNGTELRLALPTYALPHEIVHRLGAELPGILVGFTPENELEARRRMLPA